jgi:hypothetical protein
MPRKPTGNRPGPPRPPVPPDPSVKPAFPERRSEQLWRAIGTEVAHFDFDREPWPSSATPGQVADASGLTRRAIRQRRKDPLYRAAFDWQLRQVYLERLGEKLREKGGAKAAERRSRASKNPWWSNASRARWNKMGDAERERYRRWSTRRWAQRCWPEGEGASVSLDGRTFDDPLDYANYLIATGREPAEDAEKPID